MLLQNAGAVEASASETANSAASDAVSKAVASCVPAIQLSIYFRVARG
jgi:hypothetical protein